MINMKTTADKIDDISVQLKISINQANPKQLHRKNSDRNIQNLNQFTPGR